MIYSLFSYNYNDCCAILAIIALLNDSHFYHHYDVARAWQKKAYFNAKANTVWFQGLELKVGYSINFTLKYCIF